MFSTPNQNEITFFAETNFRNRRVKFGIKKDDRRRHMYLIGKTGMGKSTMLENMVLNDIYSGAGLAYVDPHGDSVEKFLDYIPSNRINDVIYFNPADIEYPIAFNILESVDPSHRHIVASGLIGVFKKLWADSWGPRLEYVLRNAILALLDYPGSTLLGIMRMLTDKAYRAKVIEKIKDPVVKSFWVDEYSKYPDKFQVEAIAPIQNKVGQFLSNFLIRNVVGQVTSTIDLRTVMDEGKILFLNLSKGRIGEDTSGLMGAMIITKIQLAAMSRVDTPEEQRRDFYLYVDEFQNFATESFANILSEARKYRLNLTIAHQYIEQLDEKVQAAVFGNVGTLVCFRVGGADAEVLVKEFTPHFVEEDMVNLTKFEIYLRLMIDGVASEPFSATGLPPLDKILSKTDHRDKVIRVSRERYAKSREIVEDKIVRWSGVNIDKGTAGALPKGGYQDQERFSGNLRQDRGLVKPSGSFNASLRAPRSDTFASYAQPNSSSMSKNKPFSTVPSDNNNSTTPNERPSQYLEYVAKQQAGRGVSLERDVIDKDPDQPTSNRPFPAQCYSCNKITYVSFEPDGKRPVFCKNCLRDERMRKAETIRQKSDSGQVFSEPTNFAKIPAPPSPVNRSATSTSSRQATVNRSPVQSFEKRSTHVVAPPVREAVPARSIPAKQHSSISTPVPTSVEKNTEARTDSKTTKPSPRSPIQKLPNR